MAMYDEYEGSAVRTTLPDPVTEVQISEVKKPKENITHFTDKQIRKSRHQNIKLSKVASSVLGVCVVLTLIFFTISGQVQVNELTSDINTAKTELTKLQSVQIQLEMQQTTSFNSQEIREFAEKELGMEPINENQIKYINMLEEDKGTVYIGNEKNIFEKIMGIFGFGE